MRLKAGKVNYKLPKRIVGIFDIVLIVGNLHYKLLRLNQSPLTSIKPICKLAVLPAFYYYDPLTYLSIYPAPKKAYRIEISAYKLVIL